MYGGAEDIAQGGVGFVGGVGRAYRIGIEGTGVAAITVEVGSFSATDPAIPAESITGPVEK